MKHYHYLTVFICLFFALACDAQDHLVDALRLLKNGEYKSADCAFSSIIKTSLTSDSSDEDVLINGYRIKPSFLYSSRGSARMEMKEYDLALADYSKSYRLSGDVQRLYDMGKCRYEKGDYGGAIKEFDKFLETDPDQNGTYLALYFRAFSVFKNGNPDRAIQDLKELDCRFPQMSKATQSTIDQCISEKSRIDALAEEKEKKTSSETEQ